MYLDYLKIICTILVVYIHAGANTGVINSISMVAVPVIFIISEYLYQSVTVRKGKQKEQVIKISKLFLMSFLFYVVWSGAVLPLIKGEAVALGEQISVVGVAKLLLLNAPTYGYHLWYLAALVHVPIIETALDRVESVKLERCADILAIVFGAIGIIIPLVCVICDLPYRIEIVRNLLFEGYPMFHIGRIIAKRCPDEAKMCDKSLGKRVPAVMSTAIMLCLLMVLLVEQNIYSRLDIRAALTDITALLAIILFLWALNLDVGNRDGYVGPPINNTDRSRVVSLLKLSGGGYSALVSI